MLTRMYSKSVSLGRQDGESRGISEQSAIIWKSIVEGEKYR